MFDSGLQEEGAQERWKMIVCFDDEGMLFQIYQIIESVSQNLYFHHLGFSGCVSVSSFSSCWEESLSLGTLASIFFIKDFHFVGHSLLYLMSSVSMCCHYSTLVDPGKGGVCG